MAERDVTEATLLREPTRDSLETAPFALDPDHPITTIDDDRLDVAAFTRRLVRPLLLHPKQSSLVVGLYGPWGYGKSSALNFLEESLLRAAGGQTTPANVHLPQPVIVRFTPWLYGSVEALLASFFETLAAVIGDQPASDDASSKRKTTLKALGEFVAPAAKVGAMFLPIPSAISDGVVNGVAELISGVAKGAATVVEGGEVTFRKRKEEAARVLLDLAAQGRGQRVIVLIDDLDRAGSDEILAMLKLVKLVADLPNVSYVIAMDKERVAAALDRALEPLRGDDFLEKIVQIGIHLPPFGVDQLSRFAVDGAIAIAQRAEMNAELLAVDWDSWEIVRRRTYEVHLRNTLRTPRDVVRLLNAYGFATLTGDSRADLHPVDLLILCLLQTRFPNVYAKVRANRRFLLHEDQDVLSRMRQEDAAGRKASSAERWSRLVEIATEATDDEDAMVGAVKQDDPMAAVLELARGRRLKALDIVLALFPHCLRDDRSDAQGSARERREARICTPEHFDGYFRLDPVPNQLRGGEVDAIFATLTDPTFDASHARTLVQRVDALAEPLKKSLIRGLNDRMSLMSPSEAMALAKAIPLLLADQGGGVRMSSEVSTLGAVWAMKRLSFRLMDEDDDREPTGEHATGFAALVAVVNGLPANEGAEFAAEVSKEANHQLALDDPERRQLAKAGLERALEHLNAHGPTLADAPLHEFAHTVWRCRHLAVRAGEVPDAKRYRPVEEYVDSRLAEDPSRLASVVALGAAWSGNAFSIPSFERRPSQEVLESINRLTDVRRLMALARAAVENGDVDRTRWPKGVREFASWSQSTPDPDMADDLSAPADDGTEDVPAES